VEFATLTLRRLAPPPDGVTRLRLAFDGSFAVPPRAREERASVIQIRIGADVFVIRTVDIAGLMKIDKVVPLPSRIPELLGLTARRGSLIPVFDLAALLGIASGVCGPSWLVLVPCETPIGLAFDGFEGRQTPEWLSEQQNTGQYVRQLVRTETAVRPLLDIPGLVEAIRAKAGLTEPAKERKL
jgi:purine-binding chemotaxis protein CheW